MSLVFSIPNDYFTASNSVTFSLRVVEITLLRFCGLLHFFSPHCGWAEKKTCQVFQLVWFSLADIAPCYVVLYYIKELFRSWYLIPKDTLVIKSLSIFFDKITRVISCLLSVVRHFLALKQIFWCFPKHLDFFLLCFSILSVNVNIGFKCTSICHMQWWEELLLLFHKSRKALKLHRSLVFYSWFCASLLVLSLRVGTINPSRLLSLPKFPIPQILLPFLDQPCLELHWNPCCGSGCVPVEAPQAAGWDRPPWSANPCSGGVELHPRLLTNRWDLYTELFHDKTLIPAPDNHCGATNSLFLTLF